MAVGTGQIGTKGSQAGLLILGGPGGTVAAQPTIPTLAKSYIAHLYNNQMVFKQTLGPITAPITLDSSINAGYRPVTIGMPSNLLAASVYGQATYGVPVYGAPLTVGDIVTLTEQGGDGSRVFTGIVEETPDTLDATATDHQMVLTPLVAELSDSYLNKNYTTATDVAQMVRDAIRQTNHCSYTNQSVPDTGILGIYNFSYASCADVLNIARLIAGINYFWHVDALGVVWFQPTGSNPTFTIKAGVDYKRRVATQSISSLKNFVPVVGGVPSGGSAPVVGIYSNPVSQSAYGVRMLQPVSVPTATDQTTINAIANTVGQVFDRIHNTIELTLPTFGNRILIGQPGGAILRYFEPAANSLTESENGPGQYSINYVVLNVRTEGSMQTVTVGDLPFNGVSDLQYALERIVARNSLLPISYTPASLNVPNTFVPIGTPGGSGAFQTSNTGARVVFDGSGMHGLDPTGIQRINLDPTNTILTFSDGTYNRVQLGKVVAYTDPNGVLSAATYGGRALDASGNTIWDTAGLASGGVMKSLGITDVGSNSFSSTTFAAISGTAINFTLTRQTNLRADFLTTGKVSAGTNNGLIRCNLVGVGTSGNAYFGPTSYITVMGWRFYSAVPAGSYTIQLEGAIDVAATTLSTIESALQLSQVGS